MYMDKFFKVNWSSLSATSLPIFKERCRTPYLPKGMKDMAATWCKDKVNKTGNL
jgi:hypothetical protein